MKVQSQVAVSLFVFAIAAGCAAPTRVPDRAESREAGTASALERPAGPKRITAAILGDPYTLSQAINSAGTGSIRGVGEVEKLIHAGLAIADGEGRWRPVLAEAVPTVENGGWRVFPDGRMETMWTLRSEARWHDGASFTTADLLFTLAVAQDRELALAAPPGLKAIDSLQAADDRTVIVRWKRPFIEADQLFSHGFALTFPRHLLEPPYTADKATFLELPYWTRDYVGAGPFRVREFVRNSHLVLAAYDQYVLGRPKLDEIVVKFISDPNVMIANVLAGEVEVTLGRGLNLEQALQVGAQWKDGRMDSKPSNWIAHYPQHLTPNPPVLSDVRFRQALLHAIDRQAMSDALQGGQAPVAHTWLEVSAPEYKEVESLIAKYDYDPRRAVQLIEGLGYTRGADGFFQDPAGQRLRVESRTNAGDDVKEKMLISGADYWQRVGVGVDVVIVPRQLASDREYRATYPGFDLVRQPFQPERFHSSEAPLPENRFSGKNRTRYMNPELDSYIDRYLSSIPRQERVHALGQILRHVSEKVLALGIFYAPEPMLIAHRLVEVRTAQAPSADETWNGHLWYVKG